MIYLVLAGVLTFFLINFFLWSAAEDLGVIVGFWAIAAIVVVIIWLGFVGLSEVVR